MNCKLAIKQYCDTFLSAINSVAFSVSDKPVDANYWMMAVIEALCKVKDKKNRIFFIGNGASCSMASHFAADFTKNGGITSFSVNDGALLSCFSNDFSFQTSYMEILKRQLENDDLLVAISSSGKSSNILIAVDYIKNNCERSQIISLSGFNEKNPLRGMGNFNLYVPASEYGLVESVHSYYLHLIIDLFIRYCEDLKHVAAEKIVKS
jgi:D-sedoheptulose 7-phosphate isomerase